MMPRDRAGVVDSAVLREPILVLAVLCCLHKAEADLLQLGLRAELTGIQRATAAAALQCRHHSRAAAQERRNSYAAQRRCAARWQRRGAAAALGGNGAADDFGSFLMANPC